MREIEQVANDIREKEKELSNLQYILNTEKLTENGICNIRNMMCDITNKIYDLKLELGKLTRRTEVPIHKFDIYTCVSDEPIRDILQKNGYILAGRML